jgi:predicted LPLAT superfamily acyltransferase
MSQQWTQHKERGSPFLIRLIFSIALRCGRTVTRIFLHPIVLYFLITATKQCRASNEYLVKVLRRKPGFLDRYRHIHCFASTILDRVYLLADRFDSLEIRIHNEQVLLNQLRKKRGCLLVGSHLGSFEVLRALAVSHGDIPLKILMYRDHNPVITRLLESLNPKVADMVIDIGVPDAMIKVSEYIDQGYAIGLLGDRISENAKVTNYDFLGESAPFPTGPALLASVLNAPIVLFFGLYRGGKDYDVYFEMLGEDINISRSNRDNEAAEWTRRYIKRLEHYTHTAPYNWFNFYDFWKAHVD